MKRYLSALLGLKVYFLIETILLFHLSASPVVGKLFSFKGRIEPSTSLGGPHMQNDKLFILSSGRSLPTPVLANVIVVEPITPK